MKFSFENAFIAQCSKLSDFQYAVKVPADINTLTFSFPNTFSGLANNKLPFCYYFTIQVSVNADIVLCGNIAYNFGGNSIFFSNDMIAILNHSKIDIFFQYQPTKIKINRLLFLNT